MMQFCCNSQEATPDAEPSSLLSKNNGGFGFFSKQVTATTEEEDLKTMSILERERALDRLHCTFGRITEDPEEIRRGLYELDFELEVLLRRNLDSAYHLAEKQDRAYVEDRKFRLMFLRADEYNPRQAAQRIIRFFDEKLYLFGEEKLTKDILYEDLSDDDRESVECGAMQVCPVRDRAERHILTILASSKKYKEVNNYVRAQFYFLMCMLEEESVQLNGFNCVFYGLDTSTNDKEVLKQTAILRHAVPIRMTSGHACIKDSRLRPLLLLAGALMDRTNRFSCRFHFGMHTEILYAMMGFGVPVFSLPFAREGEFDMENHRRWIEERRAIESSRTTMSGGWEAPLDPILSDDGVVEPIALDDSMQVEASSELAAFSSLLMSSEGLEDFPVDEFEDIAIDGLEALPETDFQDFEANRTLLLPQVAPSNLSHPDHNPQDGSAIIHETSDADVLLGRGRPLQLHPGNKVFRKLVSSRLNEYEQANRANKTKIAFEIIEQVKASSGRFLKPAEDQKKNTAKGCQWIVIDDDAARNKVAFTFRSIRKELKVK